MTSRRARSTISIALLTGLCGSLLATVPVAAGAATQPGLVEVGRVTPEPITIILGDEPQQSRVLAPSIGDSGMTSSLRTKTANITVNYTGFTPAAQASFQSAVDILNTLITALQPIVVNASFEALEPGVAGSAGAFTYRGYLDGSPQGATYYPEGLANQRAGYDLDPTTPEVVARFSSAITSWYFGTDGLTPSTMADFKSVVMHEVMHGLGFAGSMSIQADGQGTWGLGGNPYPVDYDRYATNLAGNYLVNTTAFPRPSAALAGQLTGGQLQFVGPNARRSNLGASPRLYAPSTWAGGSSYSHIDEGTYPTGNANSLMTYQIQPGESVHSPGPISLGIMRDIGWNTLIVPAQVATPSASAGPNSATVSWTAPNNGGESIENYIVKPSNGAAVTVSGTTLSQTFTGLPAGTAVSFTVQAVNGIGAGPVSASSATVTAQAPATAPSAPTGVSATPGNGGAQVSWTAPNNGGSAITYYTVTSNAGHATSVSGSSTTATVTGLTNGTGYSFTVRATNAVGTSPASAPSSAVTPAAVPGAPTAVTATAGNGSAGVSWTAPASNGSAISGYKVTASGGQTAVVSGTSTTATVTGLTNGTAYTFTVTATNGVGTSPASAPSSSVTPKAPVKQATVSDFNGDGASDAAVFHPSNGRWYFKSLGSSFSWGQNGDIPVAGDWDGDGTTDAAVYRPSTGRWYLKNPNTSFSWGQNGDIPVAGDWDGDGTTDAAVYRPSTGRWYLKNLNTSFSWGQNGDIPVLGDWDSDGTTDAAVFRPSTGRWYVRALDETYTYGRPGDAPLGAPVSALLTASPF